MIFWQCKAYIYQVTAAQNIIAAADFTERVPNTNYGNKKVNYYSLV